MTTEIIGKQLVLNEIHELTTELIELQKKASGATEKLNLLGLEDFQMASDDSFLTILHDMWAVSEYSDQAQSIGEKIYELRNLLIAV